MKRLINRLTVTSLAFSLAACASAPQSRSPAVIDTAFAPLPKSTTLPSGAVNQGLDLSSLLPELPKSGLETISEQRFDIAASNLPARDFFLTLARDADVNLVIPPALEGRISLSLQDVNLEQVLAAASDLHAYEIEKTSYGYRISNEGLHSRVFQVDYLNVEREGISRSRVSGGDMQERDINRADRNDRGQRQTRDDSTGIKIETRSKSNFWADLEVGLGQLIEGREGRSVTVNPQSGVIVATASQRELKQIARFLNAMEGSLLRQVMLEAKIVEVTLRDGFQSGINWSSLSNIGNHGSLQLTQTGSNLATGGSAANAGNRGQLVSGTLPNLAAASAFGGAFSAAIQLKDFAGFIELLQTQGDVQVLSSPRVSTLNNQKAVIKVGTDEFFVTDIASTTINSGNAITNTPSVSLTPFFSGIALDVTPQVSAEGVITLHVHPTVSDVTEAARSLPLGSSNRDVPLAVSNIRESDSIIRARSGQVVVIGGLMQTSIEDRTAGVPGISQVPLVGSLFRHKQRSAIKKELVILLRPVVIEDGDWTAQAQQSQQALNAARNW